MTPDELATSPTEAEVAALLAAMQTWHTSSGTAYPTAAAVSILRRLAFQRDTLLAEVARLADELDDLQRQIRDSRIERDLMD